MYTIHSSSYLVSIIHSGEVMSAILKENIVLKNRYILNKKGGYGNPGISSKEILITEKCICGMSVVAADFDKDGHLDLLTSMMNSNTIAWLSVDVLFNVCCL